MKRTFTESLALRVYAFLWWMLQPVYLLRIWWRGRREPMYRFAWLERFGQYRHPPESGALWVHAVSLGETRAAAPLMSATTTLAPSAANSSAMPRPKPDPLPVTIATLSLRRMSVSPFAFSRGA